jgi:dUTP pyrophosphatase
MPRRAHENDVGYDLFSREDVLILERGNHTFDTGVHIALPVGYAGMIKSKSGLNVISNITSEGVIDPDYTGSLRVKLYNNGDRAVRIRKGQKISQLVIMPVITPELEEADALEETERGAGGFGSTGKF